MTLRKTILIDLDGVLNTYSGKYDETIIPPIKDGAYQFIRQLSNDFDVKIFTTRNKLSASKWVIENKMDKYVSDVTNIKEPAWLIIDDRCVRFDGDYGKLFDKIKSFEVWYKNKQ